MMGYDCASTPPIVYSIMGGEFVSSNVSNNEEFKCAPDVDYELYYKDELRDLRERIGEMSEIHDADTRATLNLFSNARQRPGVLIFQPCWSSRRWKSLT